jgi:surface polysaccharide O-acyltransferase-like enzyme
MKQKIIWADNLRAIATFSVILIHVCVPILEQFGTILNFDWWIANCYESSVRFCVPIFLMLTGALLLPQNMEMTDFFKKRFSRVIVPFIAWSFLYVGYFTASKLYKGEIKSLSEAVNFFYLNIRYGSGASYHLWYIDMLIGVYFLLPIISKWIINASKNEIILYLIVWFVFCFNYFFEYLPIITQINIAYYLGYLGYPILGYFLMHKMGVLENKYLKPNYIAILLTSIGLLLTIISTYQISYSNGKFSELFYNYLSPNIILLSVGVFLLFKSARFNNIFINNVLNIVSKYSYGIYLIHVFILFLLSKIGLTGIFINSIIAIPLVTLLCFSISLVTIFLLNKIKILQPFLG